MAERELKINLKDAELNGILSIPDGADKLILFVHGSGSSRFSPRNRMVADVLNKAGLGTLLFDLLNEEEEMIDQNTAEFRFNIQLITERLVHVTNWILVNRDLFRLSLGYFGASTGAAAAMNAARDFPDAVKAIVLRGGRPDLAMDVNITGIETPTLFIVGGLDQEVLGFNKEAFDLIPANTPKKIEVVEGATHLFEEPGKLEIVADLAKDWFLKYLS